MEAATKPAERRPVIFSAIQPSGAITLGNYLGAAQKLGGHAGRL